MACTPNSDGLYPRISARTGQPVGLNAFISRNGVPTTPHALRRIDIYYQSASSEENLVAQILFSPPDQTGYPSPATITGEGQFVVGFEVPETFKSGVYIDVWRFIGTEPTGSAIDYDDETLWISQCNKFWVFPDGWYLDDGLITPRFAFEPLDNRFTKGTVTNLEIGLMPLPLYDYDQNKINPILPQLCPFITIETEEGEVLAGLEYQPCELGIRQGTYRTNPYVVRCLLNTAGFLKGSYVYKITLELPNSSILVSPPMRFYVI